MACIYTVVAVFCYEFFSKTRRKTSFAGHLKIDNINWITEPQEQKEKELQYFCAAEFMAEFSPRLMLGQIFRFFLWILL